MTIIWDTPELAARMNAVRIARPSQLANAPNPCNPPAPPPQEQPPAAKLLTGHPCPTCGSQYTRRYGLVQRRRRCCLDCLKVFRETCPEQQTAESLSNRMKRATRKRWNLQTDKPAIPCPRCHGACTQRYGIHRRRQRHYCLDCLMVFTEPRTS